MELRLRTADTIKRDRERRELQEEAAALPESTAPADRKKTAARRFKAGEQVKKQESRRAYSGRKPWSAHKPAKPLEPRLPDTCSWDGDALVARVKPTHLSKITDVQAELTARGLTEGWEAPDGTNRLAHLRSLLAPECCAAGFLKGGRLSDDCAEGDVEGAAGAAGIADGGVPEDEDEGWCCIM